MLTLRNNLALYGIAAAFIGLNVYLFTQEFFWLSLLPFVLALVWALIYHPYKAMLFVAFATPLSLKVDLEDLNVSMNLPTEPVMVGLLGLFLVRTVIDKPVINWKVFKHPLTIAILFNLLWILVTALTSSMPFVSVKFFLARLWFVAVFYILGIGLFSNYARFKQFIWLSSLSLSGVIVYTLIRHYDHNWEQLYANFASIPFYMNHGVYAAVIALILPLMVYFAWKPKAFELTAWERRIAIFLSILFTIALIASYTRAAWIGLVGAIGVGIVFWLRIKLNTLLLIAAAGLFVLYLNQDKIAQKLQRNKQVSASDIGAHVQSITNVSTDASNTERINRWKSAWRMFNERPVFGWGPGTYMFQYSRFQLSREMTIISVRGGTQGNAHSEYIGPLAESGVLGPVSFLAIVITSLIIAMRLVYRSHNPKIRYTALAIILGLVTYYVHGLINNYLDMDKAAVPFWALLAMLVVLDLQFKREEEEQVVRSEKHIHQPKH